MDTVQSLQTTHTTATDLKRLRTSFETEESEIRELVTQEYTGEVKPKLEEGILKIAPVDGGLVFLQIPDQLRNWALDAGDHWPAVVASDS
jgi:hypothetical protein